MQLEVRQFQASDGYTINYRRWMPDVKPIGHVLALHGIQSHSGWYEYSCRKLAESGFVVSFMDRRGSGLNQQTRGDAASSERLLRDVWQFNSHAKHDFPQLPRVLMGISWGGKLAASFAATYPDSFSGLALLYPGIHSFFKATKWQNFQLDLAEFADVRSKRVPIPLADPALFTGEVDRQEFIRNDAMTLRDVTVGFLRANRDLDRLAQNAAANIECPVLLLLAGQDRIINNAAMHDYFRRLASLRKQLIEYPHAQHTLEFEVDRDHFIQDLTRWLSWVCAA